eukprot:gene12542-14505_t
MGNASTRYLTNAETVDILGGVERWSALKITFEKIAGKSMDYRLFCSIIQRKFQNIPKALLEILFHAFAADLTRRVDMENFLSTFAVIESFGSGPSIARPTPNPQLVSLQRKCLFRIYEAHSPESGSAGTLQRRRVEEILRLAYGEALKPVYKDVQRQLDGIFNRYQSTEITLKANLTSVKSIVEQTVDEYILQALNQMITVLATPASSYTNSSTTPATAVLLHPSLLTALHHMNSTITPENYSLAFTDLIVAHLTHLPGMRDLMLCACCKFGLNPSSPLKEMELCTELSLRYLHTYLQSVQHPFGPVGTNWCVVPKGWYDSWKLYVGHQHHYNIQHTPTSQSNNTTNKRYITNTSQIASNHNNIPASIAGSVLDLDGITPFSPPSPTISQRNTAFYGSSGNRSHAKPSTAVAQSPANKPNNTMRRGPSPNRPQAMDTTVLLKKQTYFLGTAHTAIGSKQGQLLPNLVCGKDIEIVSPDVYKALISWYGGGPRISRSVVAVTNNNIPILTGRPSAIPSRPNAAYKGRTGSTPTAPGTRKTITNNDTGVSVAANVTIDTNVDGTHLQVSSVVSPRVVPYTASSSIPSDTLSGTSELELYPLCINIHTCNNSGKLLPTPLVAHLLFSKTATVQDICVFIASTHELELSRLRVWNYFHSKPDQWREQYVLSPELTLSNANIADHQILLLEISLTDGSWPRSILQSQLDNESSSIGSSSSTSAMDKAPTSTAHDAESAVNKINIDDYAVYVDEYLGTTHNHADNTTTHSTHTTLHANSSNSGGMPNYDPNISGSLESIGDTIVSTIENAASTLQSILVTEVNSVLGTPLPSQNKSISRPAESTASAVVPPTRATDKGEQPKSVKNTTLTTRQAIKAIRRNSGLVGLDNLGNTCYMNSSLQALLHTQPLVDYFLSQAYTRHINTTSIHGFKGQLAQAFGQLVCDTYSTANKSIVPRNFKNSIAAMHDQFAGHEQHDAQELLAFLLDGLSEDLNLVHTKPYTEQPDSDHRSDAVLADIWWSNHLKRDKSVIQAMFSGQFKSTMKCTHCTYTSARYEPFNFISVPVPEESDRLLTVTVVPFNVAHSVIVSVKVSKNGTLHEVVQEILALGLAGLKGVYVGGDTSIECVNNGGGTAVKEKKSVEVNKQKKHTRKTAAVATVDTSTISPNNNNTTPYYFQAGELVNHRIKSFNTLERPINNIRDSDCVVMFQVREMYGIASTHNNNNVENSAPRSGEKSTVTSAETDVDVDTATLHNTLVNAGKNTNKDRLPPPIVKPSSNSAENANATFDPECLYQDNYSDRDQWVRVAFTQRRARMHDAALYKNTAYNSNSGPEYSIMGNGLFGNTFTAVATNPNTGLTNGTLSGESNNALNKNQGANGTEYFKLEAFGIAGLEVLPNKIRCGDLYKLVALKYASYLKVPVRELIARRRKQRESQKQALKHTSSNQSLNSINSGTSVNHNNNYNSKNKHSSFGNDPNEDYPVNVRSTQVGPADSDEILGGAIPEYGFTLRLVNGGVSLYSTCSRCPWLKKCDGCILPDHAEVEVELRDGESVAVDWHFEVYETILDTTNMCKVKKHSSSTGSNSGGEGLNVTTPLARCFDKFTELEPLDDIVCPTCHNTSLSKAFTLWRLPPVLIVQLKRFRFDRTSRRKLNNQIDFPMEDLDLFDYLAPGRQRSLSRSRAATLDVTINESCHKGTTATSVAGPTSTNTDSTELARTALYGDTDSPDPGNNPAFTEAE